MMSIEEAIAARDEGMARVDIAANPLWKDEMLLCVLEACSRHQIFTSDDVFDIADERKIASGTHDLRAFGPVMMRAAKSQWCVKANCAPRASKRASLHASPRAVWLSKLYSK